MTSSTALAPSIRWRITGVASSSPASILFERYPQVRRRHGDFPTGEWAAHKMLPRWRRRVLIARTPHEGGAVARSESRRKLRLSDGKRSAATSILTL